jgi:hypothetical protein
LKRLRDDIFRAHGIDFQIRMGINTGIWWSEPSGRISQEYTAVGDTTHLAAHFLGIAKPGQIVVNPHTQHLREGCFTFEDLGEYQLKGKTDRVQAFELLGAPRAGLAESTPNSSRTGRAERGSTPGTVLPRVTPPRASEALKPACGRIRTTTGVMGIVGPVWPHRSHFARGPSGGRTIIVAVSAASAMFRSAIKKAARPTPFSVFMTRLLPQPSGLQSVKEASPMPASVRSENMPSARAMTD